MNWNYSSFSFEIIYKSNKIISLFIIVEETSEGLQQTMTVLRKCLITALTRYSAKTWFSKCVNLLAKK